MFASETKNKHTMKRTQTTKTMKTIFTAILFLAISATTFAKNNTPFKVEISGKGQAMIFIPGLSSSGDVWNETVAHYKQRYQCHVLTLPGFAGQPAMATDSFLTTMRTSLADYIIQNKLKKVIVVGHSLGGFLALWIASTNPELISLVIDVDGLPFMGATMNPMATAESMKPMAENMRKGMLAQNPEQAKAIMPSMVAPLVNDSLSRLKVLEWMQASNQATVAQAMYELFTTDIRSELSNIKCPTLVLGAWIAYKSYGATHESVLGMYNGQLAKLPKYSIELTDNGKHFIMFDDAKWMLAQMDSFIAKSSTKL